ncbi:MAG: ABC-F family ATP-binding cassette domain-containing protein [Eubacteriales bacterium]
MILSCQNIEKAFQEKMLLQNCSFHMEDYDKMAIVGINGAGKTTLLRIIVGELPADDGQVILSKGKTLGYLAQNASVNSDTTIYEELLSMKQDLIALEHGMRSVENKMKHASGEMLEALMEEYTLLTHQFEIGGGYLYQSELIGVLKGLGFEESEFSKNIGTLSGGQKTRVALGKLLLTKPDLIILDEPTNHLDMSSISWLETYLLNYKGAVLIVSHDRYFLDRIANKVVEVDNTKVSTFVGNYSDYSMKKEQQRVAQWNAYMNQQREIKHQEDVIEKLRSFNREKSIKRAESREKMLNKVEVIDKPVEIDQEMKIHLSPRKVSGNDVIFVENLKKSFGSLTLFDDLTFDIKRGEKVSIIGDNGTGKTTILKIINEIVEADMGSITLGSNVSIGYYDQEHNVLHSDKTLFNEIADDYPTLTNTEIRNVLAAFLFTGDDVFKRICDISGGERGRVSLAKLMLSEANFLILDEPTNHLDIMSKEILENALNSYTGTVLYVSHDRYFINRTATRILDLSCNTLTNYIGNYDYYIEKKDILSPTAKLAKDIVEESVSESKQDWKSMKEMEAAKRKKENQLKKVESRIEELELRDCEIDEQMSLPEVCTDVAQLTKLSKEKASIGEELVALYEEWENLA